MTNLIDIKFFQKRPISKTGTINYLFTYKINTFTTQSKHLSKLIRIRVVYFKIKWNKINKREVTSGSCYIIEVYCIDIAEYMVEYFCTKENNICILKEHGQIGNFIFVTHIIIVNIQSQVQKVGSPSNAL